MAQKPSREYMRVGRTIGILAVVLLIFGVYSVRLFQVQIVDGEKYASAANAGTKTDIEISAARGEILDTYNRPMVINRTTYEVVFDYNYFPRSGEDRRIKQAAIILSLCDLLTKAGENWQDTLPISREEPYTFKEGYESAVASLKSHLRLADYASAPQCMLALS